jgi:hypothetical protein
MPWRRGPVYQGLFVWLDDLVSLFLGRAMLQNEVMRAFSNSIRGTRRQFVCSEYMPNPGVHGMSIVSRSWFKTARTGS